ncbi:MAG: DUF1858 domain-containing protein [Corallococcus sp.]|nr:DUF1858 domain-containing protein [Corallococcus sp.]
MITKDMKIVDVLEVNPATANVFSSYGMGCIHCLLAHSETVEEAAAAHGVDAETMLAQLNAVVEG